MALSSDEMRTYAWDRAIEAEGTKSVFLRRSRKYEKYTKTRDFISLAVPILLAGAYGMNWSPDYQWMKSYTIIALSILGTAQLCLAAWSLVSDWDRDRAYYIQSSRENEIIKTIWKRIGQDDTSDIAVSFRSAQERQSILDASDVSKNITAAEMKYGMRRGLFEFSRPCAKCGEVPAKRSPPLFKRKKCDACGGN